MKTIQLEKTSAAFRRTARLARKEILVLTEKGKPAFALVGVNDEMALEALVLSKNTSFMGYLDEVSKRARGARTYSLKEIRADLLPRAPTTRRRIRTRRMGHSKS